MKRLIFVFLLIFVTGLLFSASETATVDISLTIVESVYNTGIRVVEGDVSGDIVDSQDFEDLFAISSSSLLLSYTGFDGSAIEGSFTVLVKRGSVDPLLVGVEMTHLNKAGTTFNVGYSLKKEGTVFYDTTGTNNIFPSGQTYLANTVEDGRILDVAVFTYKIPITDNVPFGEYQARATFTIEAP